MGQTLMKGRTPTDRQPKETFTDVLIIGAGPAGLMAANALASAGVKVKLVDKRPLKVAAGQADGIQPRTIEVLQSYGLAGRLIREGNQMHMTAFYNPSPNGGIERTSRAADVTAPTARFPFEITLHQGAIENIFLDSLAEKGVIVDRPYQPTNMEISQDPKVLQDPSAYAVKVTLRKLKEEQAASISGQQHVNTPLNVNGVDDDNETEIVRAKYVIGSDGAHSWVRKTLGFTMDGEQTDYIWGVVDSVPETNFPDIRNRTAIHSDNGSCMIIPREGDTVRLYVQCSDLAVGQEGRLDKDKLGPEIVMDVAQRSFKPFSLSFPSKIEWWTMYVIGQRVASQFSANERVFIAGDACHTHSPKAGQGMNASMNDTHNLAWKLAYVLRGWAQHSLLKTYESERRKYAQDLIEFDKTFSALFSGKPKSDSNVDGVSHEEFLSVFQTFGQFTSGIGIHYENSALVNPEHQGLAKHLVVGQRCIPEVVLRAADCRPYNIHDLIPSDTRFKILLFAGDIANSSQRGILEKLAKDLDEPTCFLKKYTALDAAEQDTFDLLSFCTTKKNLVNYTDLPSRLRTHWSKVYIDDVSLYGGLGGKLYDTYGISESGCIVVVRPDGYVGLVAGIDDIGPINHYFDGFMQGR